MATLDKTPFTDDNGKPVIAHPLFDTKRHTSQTLAANQYCNQLAAEMRQRDNMGSK